MKTKLIKQALAPLTKEEYDNRMLQVRNETWRALNTVECCRRTLVFDNGEQFTWNGCKQRFELETPKFRNELPKGVAYECVEANIYEGIEWKLI